MFDDVTRCTGTCSNGQVCIEKDNCVRYTTYVQEFLTPQRGGGDTTSYVSVSSDLRSTNESECSFKM